MLIIAIPKSASTSLLYTLGKMYQRPSTQLEFPDHQPCPESRQLHHYHPDIVNFTGVDMRNFSSSVHFYKQHILPTAHNLQLLRHLPKVILLRQPEEVVLAYRRAELQGHHQPKAAFMNCKTDNEWLEAAAANGLLDDLRYFYDGWSLEKNALLLNYEDLLQHTSASIRKIEHYWRLPAFTGEISLSKKRYTRYSSTGAAVFRLKNHLRKLAERAGGAGKMKALQGFLRRQGINIEV